MPDSPYTHEYVPRRVHSEEDVLLGHLVHVGYDLCLEEGVWQPQEVYQVLGKGDGLAAIVRQSGVPPVLAEVHTQFECLINTQDGIN